MTTTTSVSSGAITQTSLPGAVVVDANVAVAIAAKEADKETQAKVVLADYIAQGYELFAPGAITMEMLYALCQKFQNGLLNETEYKASAIDLEDLLVSLLPPPNGEASLVHRAYEIGEGYGCSHSADGVYIALAESLAATRPTILLTFDKELPKQAAKNAPAVSVHLLIIP